MVLIKLFLLHINKNGAGKTTTFNILTAFLPVTSGKVIL